MDHQRSAGPTVLGSPWASSVPEWLMTFWSWKVQSQLEVGMSLPQCYHAKLVAGPLYSANNETAQLQPEFEPCKLAAVLAKRLKPLMHSKLQTNITSACQRYRRGLRHHLEQAKAEEQEILQLLAQLLASHPLPAPLEMTVSAQRRTVGAFNHTSVRDTIDIGLGQHEH